MFEVVKTQLVPLPENAPAEIKAYFDGLGYELPASYGNYRNDTWAHLGTVGQSYQVMQNGVMHDIVRRAADICKLNDENIEFKAIGGGSKVAFQVELPEWAIAGKDKVKRLLTVLTSHDGSTKTGIGHTGIRVVCQNTWFMAYRQCSQFKHTVSGNENAVNLANSMLTAIEEEFALKELFEELNNKKIRKIDIEPFLLNTLEITKKEIETSGRVAGKFERFMAGINHEVKEIGLNGWGLFNGITYATNHLIKREDQYEYLLFNDGAKINDRALKLLQAY